MSSLTLFKLDSLSSPSFSFCLVAQKTEVNEENMRRNLYDYFFLYCCWFLCNEREQMFRRSCKSRALFFIPVFFLPATTRMNDKYVHFCVFFTWSPDYYFCLVIFFIDFMHLEQFSAHNLGFWPNFWDLGSLEIDD